MHLQSLLTASDVVTRGGVCRATVSEILDTGEVRVVVSRETPIAFACDVLRTSAAPAIALSPGDEVLVLLPASDDVRGCILGSVGPYVPPPAAGHIPQRIEIKAQREVSLSCGESSITLRPDGKLLIKGVDVVTRAKRTHKIKAGSVHIN